MRVCYLYCVPNSWEYCRRVTQLGDNEKRGGIIYPGITSCVVKVTNGVHTRVVAEVNCIIQ